MRGRKPTPTNLRLLHNNPGKRPINRDEPQHEPIDTRCPDELTGEARVEWDRIASKLSARGQVSDVDRGALIAYCAKYGQWRELEVEAAKHPNVVKVPSGYPIPNPLIGMANKVYTLMQKAAAELGITPSSRSRVGTVKGKASSKLGMFLSGNRRTG